MKRPPPRRALVTGGLGFIGSALVRRLAALGTRVEVLDALIPTHGGLRFNLAGVGRRALEAFRKRSPAARVVFTSTRQVYGRPERLPVDEDHPVRPADVNGIHKLGAEWYFRLYARVYGLKASVLRLTNTYGPRMRVRDARQNFVGDWVRRALTGRPIKIFGDGAQRRDFNYVDDVVDALLAAASGDAAAGREVLSLPLYPELSDDEAALAASAAREACAAS